MGRLVEPARELSQHRERKREERERERHSQTAIKKASKQDRKKKRDGNAFGAHVPSNCYCPRVVQICRKLYMDSLTMFLLSV